MLPRVPGWYSPSERVLPCAGSRQITGRNRYPGVALKDAPPPALRSTGPDNETTRLDRVQPRQAAYDNRRAFACLYPMRYPPPPCVG